MKKKKMMRIIIKMTKNGEKMTYGVQFQNLRLKCSFYKIVKIVQFYDFN